MLDRRFAALITTVALVAAACGGSSGSPAPASPSAAASSPSPAVASSSPAGASSAPSAAPAASVDAAALIDPSLLDIFPSEIDGVVVQRSTDTEDAAVASPDLPLAAEAFTAAEMSDPSGENLAIASLLLVRPDLPADDFYGGYRDSFDRSACASVGGVDGTGTEEIGGRTVETTTCGGGATIYHLRLRGGRLIVSVLELGPKQFGRQLVESVTD